MAVSIGTTTCTAILLYQQLSLIFHGLTYIDSLKQIKAKGRGATPASSSSSSHAHGVPYQNGDRDGGRESERLLDAKGPSWGGDEPLGAAYDAAAECVWVGAGVVVASAADTAAAWVQVVQAA